jgi:hypothetical protein
VRRLASSGSYRSSGGWTVVVWPVGAVQR